MDLFDRLKKPSPAEGTVAPGASPACARFRTQALCVAGPGGRARERIKPEAHSPCRRSRESGSRDRPRRRNRSPGTEATALLDRDTIAEDYVGFLPPPPSALDGDYGVSGTRWWKGRLEGTSRAFCAALRHGRFGILAHCTSEGFAPTR